MSEVLGIVAPIFLVMAFGYGAVRFGLLQAEQVRGLGVFVLNVALPALIFHALAGQSFSGVWQPEYLRLYGGSALVIFLLGVVVTRWFWREPLAAAALNGLGLAFGNSGFIGLPVLSMVLGSEVAARYFAMNMLVENFLLIPLMLILADFSRVDGGRWWVVFGRLGGRLLRNPLLLALAVALGFSLGGVAVPETLGRVTGLLAPAAAPVALFVIGGSLYGLRVRGELGMIGFVGLGRVVLHPLLVVGVFCVFGGASLQDVWVGALFASVSVASTVAMLGQRYGYGERIAAMVVVSTLASFVSMGAVLLLWQRMGGF